MPRRAKRIVIPIVLLLAAGAVGVSLWRHYGEEPPSNRITLYGNVDIRQVNLAFVQSERISAMLVREGDRVRAGQVVARLETVRLNQAVAEAENRVAAQRQVVARLEAGSRPQEIRQAEADVKAAEATARYAELNSSRLAQLAAKAAASQDEADQARSAADAAQARLRAVQEFYNLVVAGPRQEDIASAKATLAALEATLARARQDLTDAELFAPAEAIVQTRVLEPGDMASPQTPAYTLALISPLWVRAYIGETDLGRIRPGMTADVHTDSFPGKTYKGWIGYISPTAEFTPKSVETPEIRTTLVYQVRVFVDNPEGELRLGMPATVVIPLDRPAPTETPPTTSAPTSAQGE